MYEHLSNYFDDNARLVLKEGVAAWHRLTQHEDWNGWLRVGKAIAQAQDIAADVTGSTSGKNFNAFMASCYAKPTYLGEFAAINKSERSVAVKCWRNREDIEKWRQSIGMTKAMRMNHPMTVWAAFEASRRPPTERPVVASPFAQLKLENVKLQEQLDRAKKERDGDFTINLRDHADDIAELIISSLGDRRAEEVATAIRRKRGKKA